MGGVFWAIGFGSGHKSTQFLIMTAIAQSPRDVRLGRCEGSSLGIQALTRKSIERALNGPKAVPMGTPFTTIEHQTMNISKKWTCVVCSTACSPDRLEVPLKLYQCWAGVLSEPLNFFSNPSNTKHLRHILLTDASKSRRKLGIHFKMPLTSASRFFFFISLPKYSMMGCPGTHSTFLSSLRAALRDFTHSHQSAILVRHPVCMSRSMTRSTCDSRLPEPLWQETGNCVYYLQRTPHASTWNVRGPVLTCSTKNSKKQHAPSGDTAAARWPSAAGRSRTKTYFHLSWNVVRALRESRGWGKRKIAPFPFPPGCR